MKHKEWRKVAKKERRRKIRQSNARERDKILDEERLRKEASPTYEAWQSAQRALELFKVIEEERLNKEANERFLQEEIRAQQLWRELQEKIKRAREERAKQDLRIKQEWEEQERKKKEIEDEKIRIQEEKQQKYEKLMQQIDNYINQGGDMPSEMKTSFETNPAKPPCPFFAKTGACRFGDRCSRNHPRPGFSKVLLIPNFYTHFGMDQSGPSEYDSDLLLEYEDSETYDHFKEFFYDVLPEFQKCGNVVQFKVCSNSEPHLRGNVYVEFDSERDAVGAFKAFQGRWYGGRQLNVEFSSINSWRAAICGMVIKQTCPKGRSCNFLHVFRNPKNLFRLADRDLHRRSKSKSRSRSRSLSFDSRSKDQNWRWSESPEPNAGQTSSERKSRKRSRSPSSSRSKRNGDRSRRKSKTRNDKTNYSKRKDRTRSRSSSRRSHRSDRSTRSSRYQKSRS